MTLLVSPTEIDNNKNRYETSTDFATGDKINLAGLIANSNLSGDQDFSFVGANAFTDVAGQLRYQYGYQPIGDVDVYEQYQKYAIILKKLHALRKTGSASVSFAVPSFINSNFKINQVINMKSKLSTLLALSLAMLAYIPVADAHSIGAEGAGFITGLAHPFIGLDHLLAMIAVGIWAAQTGGSAVWRLPLSFVMMMAVAALISASGYGLPTLEPLLAGSVITLGLMVVFAIRMPVNLSMLLIGLFAVFHGYAHGLEMPQANSAILYGSGFVLATSLLHLIGIGLGKVTYRKHLVSRLSGSIIALAGLYLATTV